ncbi:MAG: ABC transporter substrate-binding protein [Betaproteobacteria bacterium]
MMQLSRRPFRVAAACIAAGIALAAGVVVAQAAAPAWADPAKTIRVLFPIAETGFDPAASQDYYSDHVQRAIFEPLYSFDYLARPYRFVPNVAAAMPEVSADGRTWTIRLKPGIRFADDPVWKGKPRELVAADFVYAWKRLIDPRVRSPFSWYLDGKIVGGDAAAAKAKATGKFDYDAPMEGLVALDRYSLRLTLVEPDFVMQGYLSQTPMAPIAREVVEAYGDGSGWVMANPVGTGAYRVVQWRRGQKIVLEANPDYREVYFPAAPDGASAATRALATAMKGKRLPQVGRVEISIIEESNPQFLAFDSRELDYVNVPYDLITRAIAGVDTLRPEYAKEGVTLHRETQPSLFYAYFNMEDPVVGGYTPEKIALRRAIVMGFDIGALAAVWYQGQAMPATQPIPPGVKGHQPGLDVGVRRDPKLARALLDKFGYVDRDGDGFRELPDGRPLTLMMGSSPSGRDRERDELWVKNMREIGIRVDFVKQKWPDLLKMGRVGQLQMWQVGWITLYGEGDAFMQLLYGPNIDKSNYARFRNAEYDVLYRRTRGLPDGAARNKLFARMAEIAAAYTPWDLGVYRVESTLVRPWVQGYSKHIYLEHPWKYLDVDLARRQAGR